MRDVAGSFGKSERYLAVATLLGTLACTGVLEQGDSKPGGDGPPLDSPPGAPASNPGRGEMHRLNSTEYNLTVGDVLGTTLKPASGTWRGGEIEGFDNVASVLGVDET